MSLSRSERARGLFEQGANCAQAVAGAFADVVGMKEEELFKLASGFGGGVGRMREVCGAVSGMVLIMNMLYGNDDITDKSAKDAHYERVQKLIKRFETETGSIICRTLLQLAEDADTPPVSEARTKEYYQKRPCAALVELAAQILEADL
ncbi:MAG: C_GCAxxG_C_C family protein [Lentisphaeria bacterium]|nr:C_GCAxxG_C_C family protein [Lentisphaeria bacterium]